MNKGEQGITGGAVGFHPTEAGSIPVARSISDEMKVAEVLSQLDGTWQFNSDDEKTMFYGWYVRHVRETGCLVNIKKPEYAFGGGIGTVVFAVCGTCGVKEDVTDYETW